MIFLKILAVITAVLLVICVGCIIWDLARSKESDFINSYSTMAMAFFLLATAVVIVYYVFWRI